MHLQLSTLAAILTTSAIASPTQLQTRASTEVSVNNPLCADTNKTSACPIPTSTNQETCSFHLVVLQECAYSPQESWHLQSLGLVFSIQGPDNTTVLRYPEGLGRFDGADRTQRLVNRDGQPDLYSVFVDGTTYFRSGECAWDSYSRTDSGLCGRCVARPWTKTSPLKCSGDGGMQYRFTDMDCYYKCDAGNQSSKKGTEKASGADVEQSSGESSKTSFAAGPVGPRSMFAAFVGVGVAVMMTAW